ncbi:MAG: hypothetical protein AAGC60_09725 [Acidobacteriota bacterium]
MPTPRRALGLTLLVALSLWTVLQGARETRRAAALAAADPWSDEQPELWTLRSGAVARLEAMASQLRSVMPADASLAVTPAASLEWRGDFVVFWLAFTMPERTVRPASRAADALAADYWLSWPADTTAHGAERTAPHVPPWRLESVLRVGDAHLQRVLPPPSAPEPTEIAPSEMTPSEMTPSEMTPSEITP